MKNLRIYIDKNKHEIYEKLVKRGSENPENYPFQTMKDMFMLAACLGVKNNVYIPLETTKDIFNSDVFDEKTDIPVIAALAYKREQDISILSKEREMLDLVQEFANGGIGYVEEEIINNPGRPLDNLISLLIN
jgi:dnd system-associated protein 4